jgi:hypothetical protein
LNRSQEEGAREGVDGGVVERPHDRVARHNGERHDDGLQHRRIEKINKNQKIPGCVLTIYFFKWCQSELHRVTSFHRKRC